MVEERPQLKVLGVLEMACGDRRLGRRDLGGIKPKQLLEILVLARGKAVPKDRLAELLWGDALPQNVSTALENHVSVLRRHLDPCGGRRESLVVTEPGAYRFAIERADVDLDRFDALVARSVQAGPGRRRCLEEALALVRGDLLEDEPYADWALEARSRFQVSLVDVLLDAGQAALAERDIPTAFNRAEWALRIDELSEPAYRLAIVCHYALGRQNDALRLVEQCRRVLAAEIGVEPMEETEALSAAVARHEDVGRLLPPRPAMAGSGAVPEARPTGRRRSDLPFLGRKQELRAIQEAVGVSARGMLRFALVEGELGIGKSRLLEEAAGRLGSLSLARARCLEAERHLPYVPLADALRPLADGSTLDDPALRAVFPELGAHGDGTETTPLQALEALVVMVRRLSPLVLLLDDLQWADPHTVAALGYLARRCADVPVTVLGAYRTEDVGLDHPLRRLDVALHLRLAPLERVDLATLDGADELFARTKGHPLLLASALEAPDPGRPDRRVGRLRDRVVARCRAGGGRSYEVLLAAAALVDPFDPATLAAVIDAGPPANLIPVLEGLCEQRLLVPDGDGFVLRYPILGEALLADVSLAYRLLLAERAGGARPTGPSDAGRVALSVNSHS